MKDIAESYNSHFEKLEQEQEELYIIENIYYEIQNAAQNGEYFIDYEIEKSNLIKFSEILINDRYFLIVKKIVITILQLQYRG
jgi:ectoine hydroxylase-related dioxygenase (phytanoyl-CoA dioxygenase family)